MIRLVTRPVPQGPGPRRLREEEARDALIASTLGPEAVLTHDADGAPRIASRPDIHISISHCADLCLLAVSDRPVGVDIETVRPKLARVAGRFMSAAELYRLDPEADTYLDSLLHYWTAKEAVYKLLRTPGLPLQSIVISPYLDSASAHGRRATLLFQYQRKGVLIATAFLRESVRF